MPRLDDQSNSQRPASSTPTILESSSTPTILGPASPNITDKHLFFTAPAELTARDGRHVPTPTPSDAGMELFALLNGDHSLPEDVVAQIAVVAVHIGRSERSTNNAMSTLRDRTSSNREDLSPANRGTISRVQQIVTETTHVQQNLHI